MMLCIGPSTAAPPAPPPRPYVLLVDDHEPSLRSLQTLVEMAGHPCLATPSSPEALVYCDRKRPAVVVTDLAMPRLDGSGLARWIKARYPALPILLVTGEDLDPAALSALELTFVAVLTKPIPVESFLGLLGELMAGEG